MPTTQHGPHPLIPPLRDAVVVIIVHVLRNETALELFCGADGVRPPSGPLPFSSAESGPGRQRLSRHGAGGVAVMRPVLGEQILHLS